MQSFLGAQQETAKTAIGATLLVANVVIAQTSGGYFDAPAETNPLLHTWSLSVEEQFYLVFPLVLTVGWRLARKGRFLWHTPYLLISVVALLSFALAVLGSTGYSLPRASWLIGFYSPFTRVWEFAAGALLALSANTAVFAMLSRSISTILSVIGFAMLAASLWLIRGTTPFPGLWTLLPVTGTLLLLLAGTHGSNPITRALEMDSLVKVGDWSYSIYLWHWPLIVFAILLWPDSPAAPAIAALVCLIPSISSFKYVEQPIRRLVPRTRLRLVTLVVATMLLPLAFAGMLGVGARAQWWMNWETATTLENDYVAMSRGCTDRPFDPDLCRWGTDLPNGTIFLVGDSQAYTFADGVIEAAARLGMNTVVSSRSGCPFSTIDTTGTKPLDCHSWQLQTLLYALRTKPDAVVVANRSSGYTRPESGWRTFIDMNGKAATPDNAMISYEIGLKDVTKQLRDNGIGVVIIQDIAEPERLDGNSSIIRRLLPVHPVSFDPMISIANRSRAVDAESMVAYQNSGIVLYDPIPVLCQERLCPFVTPTGKSIYIDKWHLTRDGALQLAPSLVKALREAFLQR
jgi:peptidoglycan/LPS O-acetylase OafA/YrhL